LDVDGSPAGVAQAAVGVRALMFIERFSAEVNDRLTQLDSD
jgi:hypothetical protein